jgi:hypothetical protein
VFALKCVVDFPIDKLAAARLRSNHHDRYAGSVNRFTADTSEIIDIVAVGCTLDRVVRENFVVAREALAKLIYHRLFAVVVVADENFSFYQFGCIPFSVVRLVLAIAQVGILTAAQS